MTAVSKRFSFKRINLALHIMALFCCVSFLIETNALWISFHDLRKLLHASAQADQRVFDKLLIVKWV